MELQRWAFYSMQQYNENYYDNSMKIADTNILFIYFSLEIYYHII